MRKAERSKQIERTLQDLEKDGERALEDAQRKAAEQRSQIAAGGGFLASAQVTDDDTRRRLAGEGGSGRVEMEAWLDQSGGDTCKEALDVGTLGPRSQAGALRGSFNSKPAEVENEAERERVGGPNRAREEAEGETLEQVRLEASSERSEILQHFKRDARAKHAQILRQSDGGGVRSNGQRGSGPKGAGSARGFGSLPGSSTDGPGFAWSPHARSEGGSPLRLGRVQGLQRGHSAPGHTGDLFPPGRKVSQGGGPVPGSPERVDDVSVGGGSLRENAPPTLERSPERQRQGLPGDPDSTTAQLMEDLRKHKVTSPERMARQGLEADPEKSNGNGSVLHGAESCASPEMSSGWSLLLDEQNESEGNVEMRLGRVRTRTPETGRAPAVKLAFRAKPDYLPGVAHNAKLEPGSGVAISTTIMAPISSVRREDLSLRGGPSIILEAKVPSGAPIAKSNGPLDSAKGQTLPYDVSSQLDAPLLPDAPWNQSSDRRKPPTPGQAPAFRISEEAFFVEPARSSIPEGASLPAEITPLESAPPGDEGESPQDDFDDMESLSSTVTSARASGFDGGRHVWEEQFGERGSGAMLRANSLPVQVSFTTVHSEGRLRLDSVLSFSCQRRTRLFCSFMKLT